MILQMTTLEAPGGVSVVQLSGNMALGNVLQSTEEKIRSLIKQTNGKVVLDLAGVNYCDSAGIGALMAVAGVARERGGDVRLAGVTARVQKVVTLTQVDRLLNVYPSVEEALQNF